MNHQNLFISRLKHFVDLLPSQPQIHLRGGEPLISDRNLEQLPVSTLFRKTSSFFGDKDMAQYAEYATGMMSIR